VEYGGDGEDWFEISDAVRCAVRGTKWEVSGNPAAEVGSQGQFSVLCS
jgi:hypothetical protein